MWDKVEKQFSKSSRRLCVSYSDPLQEPGTSKQLTLCLTHNEALLESHVGEDKEGAGREGVKREENMKYLYSCIQRPEEHYKWAKACAHMQMGFFF